ncbi:hypothetical protein GCM10009613_01150 [Pseudonocardia kongjuensis]|uniref:Uncharacterized protein n=1 Tax=Pseudonocardia kongjuensis TaxID=102227 RepID=A0ABN1XIM7_9PSEU
MRYRDLLGLAARQARMQAVAGVQPVRVVRTLRHPPGPAGPAPGAADRAGNEHPVAGTEPGDLRSDPQDVPDRLVPDAEAGALAEPRPVVELQVGAADARGAHRDHRTGPVRRAGLGDVEDGQVARAAVHHAPHRALRVGDVGDDGCRTALLGSGPGRSVTGPDAG